MAKGKILVIDDDIMVCRFLSDMLQNEGYQVQVVASGREGLEWAAKNNYDVALVDIRMPDLDGMEVLRALRERDEDLKALIITGYPALETATQAVRLGAFDYLLKPLETERVLISVQNALATRQLALTNKQLLHDLQRANVELEIRVQERTAELAKVNEELRIEIAERKRVEEQIQASLKEKEVLLKEIHHRVKTNLQVVSSILDFQSEYIKDQQALQIFRESQNQVRSMALIHEQLYQSKDLASIDFAGYIRSLAGHLFQSYGVNRDAITLKINADDISLSIDTAIPCSLIINELVSNSLKHAFSGGKACSERGESKGEICIGFHSNAGQFTLIISDNGVGLPKDLDFRNTQSLGLRLVNMLTRQLKGAIELDRSSGTTFKIHLRDQNPRERSQDNDKCTDPDC